MPFPFRPALALLAGLGLAACAQDPAPSSLGPRNTALAPPGAGGPAAPPPPAAGRATAPTAQPRVIPETPVGEGRNLDQAGLLAACNRQAEQDLMRRDRSEIMREDERDSRLGTFDSTYQFRAPIDQMGRRYERDRLARECVLRNSRGTPER